MCLLTLIPLYLPFHNVYLPNYVQGHDGKSIDCVAISENGYHVATSSSSADSPVHVWDLRKLKLSATIETDVGRVTSLAFDPTATYLAYAGEAAAKVCVAKDWDRVVCSLALPKGGKKKKAEGALAGGVAWGGEGLGAKEGEKAVWLATGCDGQRPVRIWGLE